MKKFIFVLVLLISLDGFAFSDAEIVGALKSYVSFGTFKGKTRFNKKCIVEVTEKEHLDGIGGIGPSQYKLEIFSSSSYGLYGFTTNTISGGRGDCANIKYDTGTLLEVKNSGPGAPCFSSPTKSNAKGVRVVYLKQKKVEITTLAANGGEEISCIIE